MSIKHMTEEELLADLDANSAHADELAKPLPKELTPLEKLKGSVKRYEGPFDELWYGEEYKDDESAQSDPET